MCIRDSSVSMAGRAPNEPYFYYATDTAKTSSLRSSTSSYSFWAALASRRNQSAPVRRLYGHAVALGGNGAWPARFGLIQLTLEDLFGVVWWW